MKNPVLFCGHYTNNFTAKYPIDSKPDIFNDNHPFCTFRQLFGFYRTSQNHLFHSNRLNFHLKQAFRLTMFISTIGKRHVRPQYNRQPEEF